MKMLTEPSDDYDENEIPRPTEESAKAAERVLEIIQNLPSVFPDGEDGGIRFEWHKGHGHVTLVFPNGQAVHSGEGIFYWHFFDELEVANGTNPD
jgi:hypothetical protein